MIKTTEVDVIQYKAYIINLNLLTYKTMDLLTKTNYIFNNVIKYAIGKNPFVKIFDINLKFSFE